MRRMAILKWAFLAVGLGLLAGAGLFALSTRSFLARASTAEGTVVDLSESRSKDSSGERTTYYHPVVRFVGQDGSSVEFRATSGSSPPAYRRGQKVTVLYDPASPHEARIDGFLELWGLSVVFAGVGTIFSAIGGAIFLVGAFSRRRGEELRRRGTRIETTFQRVELNEAFSFNGRHPFRIVSQWLNPATNQVHVFESENLWFDPSPYLRGREITVFIERGNARRYHVDVSFLPKLAA